MKKSHFWSKFLSKVFILGFLILVFSVGFVKVEAVSDIKFNLDLNIPVSKINPVISKIEAAGASIRLNIFNTAKKIVSTTLSTAKDITTYAKLSKAQLAQVTVPEAINIWKNYVVVPPSISSTTVSLPKETVIVRQGVVSDASLLASLQRLLSQDSIRLQLQGPQGIQGPQGPSGTTTSFLPLSAPSFAPTNYNNGQIIGSSAGYASLGVEDLIASKITLNGNITQGSSYNATLGGLTVTNNQTIGGTLTVTGTTTLNGLTITNSVLTSNAQSTFTKVPTLAHVFAPSWPSGTSNASDGTIYINPASSIADGNLISAAVGGTIKFLVDAEGDVYAGNLILSGSTSTGATTIAGNLTVQDNTTFGDAITDTVTIVGATSFGGGYGSTGLSIAATGNLQTNGTLTVDGALTALSYNGLTVTTSTGTLTIANGKTATISNTLTFTGTDASSVAFGAGGTVAYTANNLSVFAATTSAQLAGVISDETGSGALVFGTSPTFTTPALGTPSALVLTNATGLPAASILAGTLGTGAYVMDTSLTVPTIVGGTGTTSDLNLKTTSGVGADGADMHFLVGNNGATEAMTILNSGNVGIGTTAPVGKLDVASNGHATTADTVLAANFTHLVSGTYTANNYYPLVGLRLTNQNPTKVNSGIYAQETDNGSNLVLGGSGNGTQGISPMLFIKYDGNIGIGTTAPLYKLQIFGADASPSLSAASGIVAIDGGTNTNQLAIGTYSASPFGVWFQAKDNLSSGAGGGTSYPILLNPLGGKVGIGIAAPNTLLHANTASVSLALLTLSSSALDAGGEYIDLAFDRAANQRVAAVRAQLESCAYCSSLRFRTQNTVDSLADRMTINENGYVGIGTTNPQFNRLDVVDNNPYGVAKLTQQRTVNDGDTRALVMSVGTVSSATTPQFVTFYADAGNTMVGKIRLANNATAYDTTSDQRLKNITGITQRGLDTLMDISIYDYSWKNDAQGRIYQGFMAQELYPSYPEAVAIGGDDVTKNPWGVDYGRLTPLIIKSIQEVTEITSSFKTNLIAWLSDTANGVTDFFANRIRTRELCVGDDSGAETCLNKAQVDALLGNVSSGSSSGGGGSTPPVDEPPAEETPPAEDPAPEEEPVVEETPAEEPAPEPEEEPTPEPEPETP